MRQIGIALGAATALLFLGALGVRTWLGSVRGQALVRGRLERLVRERIGVTLHIGRVRGGLVAGVTLEDLSADGADGAWQARAPRLEARWTPWSLWARRPGVWVHIERPQVRVHAPAAEVLGGPSRAPLEVLAGVGALAIGRLTVSDGTLEVEGPRPRALAHVELSVRARLERGRERGALVLDALRAEWRGPWGAIPLEARATLAWDLRARRAALPSLAMIAGETQLAARGLLAAGRLDLALAPVHLAPREARALWPLGVDPRHPIDAALTLSGALPRLAVRSRLLPGHGAAWLRGELDVAAGTAAARALVRRLRPDFLQMGAASVLSGVIDLRWGRHGLSERARLSALPR